jgi:hypothetical protein
MAWLALGAVVFFWVAFWILALGMLWVNAYVWWLARHAKAGERVPSAFPLVAGGLCAFMVFISLPFAKRVGIEVPWPWLWIALPLLLDMQGLGGMIAALLGLAREKPRDEPR